jgi:uncharacterized LabA/DUF88 family protein
MRNIVRGQHGAYQVEQVHFFTAPAKEAFATHGKDSVVAQQSYHRALQERYPAPHFQMTLGNHVFDRNGSLMPRYVEGQACDKTDRIRVWALEEKQTDVNLALGMYRGCSKAQCDQVVVCSNDSDVAPVLKAIREDFPNIQIGVITPAAPQHKNRRISSSLAEHAHWVRRHISDEELQAAQLPDMVPTKNKPARKPTHW